MQDAPWTVDQDNFWEARSSIAHFAILPLVATAIDHLADVNVAYRGDMYWPWVNLCQSTLQTFFFIRPLFMLVGHDLNPQSGHIGIALCFLGTALWLSLPAHSLLGGMGSDGRMLPPCFACPRPSAYPPTSHIPKQALHASARSPPRMDLCILPSLGSAGSLTTHLNTVVQQSSHGFALVPGSRFHLRAVFCPGTAVVCCLRSLLKSSSIDCSTAPVSERRRLSTECRPQSMAG
ncbi:hypothetical protein J3E72DRAFT_273726 [Bipolaris maydis]|nr:hypothetical protein J3E72DRAFT_273726 [Bipolaris maydis]